MHQEPDQPSSSNTMLVPDSNVLPSYTDEPKTMTDQTQTKHITTDSVQVYSPNAHMAR